MTENLLPCPFCGGEAEIVGGPENWTPTFYDPDSGGDPIAVVCQCGITLGFFDEYEDALVAWNSRAKVDAVPVVRGDWDVAIGYDPNKKVQCQNCYKMAYEPTPYCPNCGAKMESEGGT